MAQNTNLAAKFKGGETREISCDVTLFVNYQAPTTF